MRRRDWLATRSGAIVVWLAVLICCSVAGLAWFGYRAADEWQSSSASLVERRTREIADLLTTALKRDMRAVQVSVLDGRDWDPSSPDGVADLTDTVEAAFARYPYPEVFFSWYRAPGTSVFFARSDRRPGWLPKGTRRDTYPVELLPAAPIFQPLLSRIERDIQARNQYATFETKVDGRPYQVIARILYRDVARDQPEGVFGFMVDLEWVRQSYFSSIAQQITRIAQAGDGIACTILDQHGNVVVGKEGLAATGWSPRPFPMLFFDPVIVAGGAPADLPLQTWSVNISQAGDPTLAIAARGARRTLLVMAAAAFVVAVGLFVTVRAARSSADIAAMRSDLVSTVTHGLKTPVSVIRGIGETLIRGRVETPTRLHEYAQLLVQEGHRLSRMIENILAYARVTDAGDVYSFEPQDPAEVVEEVLRGFHRVLAETGFSTDVTIAPDLPLIRADRTALVLAIDNLIDNAVQYSGDARGLRVEVRQNGTRVEIAVSDSGKGIPPNELDRVRQRFVRGRSANSHGSGLGLAIASRIASDHGGTLRMESVVGQGTTATLVLPEVEG